MQRVPVGLEQAEHEAQSLRQRAEAVEVQAAAQPQQSDAQVAGALEQRFGLLAHRAPVGRNAGVELRLGLAGSRLAQGEEVVVVLEIRTAWCGCVGQWPQEAIDDRCPHFLLTHGISCLLELPT